MFESKDETRPQPSANGITSHSDMSLLTALAFFDKAAQMPMQPVKPNNLPAKQNLSNEKLKQAVNEAYSALSTATFEGTIADSKMRALVDHAKKDLYEATLILTNLAPT